MSAPIVIGGGELAQSVWFELKEHGVKSPTVLQSTISLIGKHVAASDAQLNCVFDDAFSKGVFAGARPDSKDGVRAVFMRAFGSIRQFLSTNVPHVMSAQTGVNLGYHAGSLTIQT